MKSRKSAYTAGFNCQLTHFEFILKLAHMFSTNIKFSYRLEMRCEWAAASTLERSTLSKM